MTGALPVEGSLELSIQVTDGRFSRVSILNRRPLSIATAFTGQQAGAAVGLCARLFSICRFAQGLAAAEAVERAGQAAVSPSQRQARQVLLAAEAVLEHAGRSLLVWPDLLGEPVRIMELKTLREALTGLHLALYPDGDWMRPGGGRLAPDQPQLIRRVAAAAQVVRNAVLGGDLPKEISAWADWCQAGTTTAPRMARRLEERGIGAFGASPITALPVLPLDDLNARLAADEGAFTAAPDWDGVPRITGPYARHHDHPLVAALGQGLCARLAARLVELSQALRRLQELVHGMAADPGQPLAAASGSGLSMIEAARGLLAHRVELEQGRVRRYQILAPTEWNFHPQGALPQGLIGRPAGDKPELRARHLIASLDPCVACRVEVSHA
ncbi:MAG TPA: nickel-dependent hydrogenase large subunit [Candidatus Sulfotelmatobacter sp.]|nr:nickel-dependent hydrogenase large subunit [Candidatus Sulfotelmatobacter sp.]